MAMVQVITSEGLVDLGAAARPRHRPRRGRGRGWRRSRPRRWPTPPASTADDIRRLARELAAAPSACVYGRIGTTTAEFGTLASWLVDVLNVLTGNLDRPGGAMFTKAAAGRQQHPRQAADRAAASGSAGARSRVRGLPETCGELPAVVPGRGDRHARRGPDPRPGHRGRQPGAVHAELGRPRRRARRARVMVSVDIYVNETTRHADVILPAPSARSRRRHYDLALLQLALRNVANYSEPVLPLDAGQPDEWEVLARLALVLQGDGRRRRPRVVDDLMITSLVQRSVGDETSPIHGRDADEILAALAPRTGPGAHPRLPCCAPVPTARASAPTDEGAGVPLASTCCSPTRTGSTSAPSSPGCPTCCARPTA